MGGTIPAVFERGTLRPLRRVDLSEGQPVSLAFEPVAMTPSEAAASVEEWGHAYDGLTEEEKDEVDAIALDRSDFMQPAAAESE